MVMGVGTRLDPPVEVDGVVCGLAFQLRPAPGNGAWPPAAIGSWTIERVIPLGGGVLRLVIERGVQRSHWTRTNGPGDIEEVPYDVVAGGNCASPSEDERVIAYNNAMATRGSLDAQRLVPGNIVAFTAEGTDAERWFLVVAATAYAVAPTGGIDWRPGLQGTPGAPGRPPRMFNQADGAEAVGDGSTGTTNPATNRANWHDAIDIWIGSRPEECPAAPGMSFVGRRAGVFDPRETFAAHVDRRGDSGSGWLAIVPGVNGATRPLEGLVLVAESVRAAHPGATWCCRGEGTAFEQLGLVTAAAINDPIRALAATDALWMACPPLGGASLQVSGYTSVLEVGGTAWACASNGWWVPTAAAHGIKRRTLRDITNGTPWGYWRKDGDIVAWWDALGRDNPSEEGNATCGSDVRDRLNVVNGGDFAMYTTPFSRDLSSGVPGSFAAGAALWWGGVSRHDTGAGVDPGQAVDATFSFQSIPFGLPARLQRMLEGAEILEALLEVTTSGLVTREWEATSIVRWRTRSGVSPPTSRREYLYLVDGATVLDRLDVDGVTIRNIANPLPSPSRAKLALSLVEVLPSSEVITLVGGGTTTATVLRTRALGAAMSAQPTPPGQPAIVDVRDVVRAALATHRRSNYPQLCLYPSSAGVAPSDTPAPIGDYLRSLLPAVTCSFAAGPGGSYADAWGFDAAASGAYSYAGGISLGTLLVRYRLPGSALDRCITHRMEPPAI